jgi:uncharacterized FlaG/YvyC family protein
MDVQATSSAGATTALLPPGYTAPAAPSAPAAATAAAPVSGSTIPVISGTDGGSSGSTFNSPIGETPGLATLPVSAGPGDKKASSDSSLASGVAKLYNAAEQNVSVSFQVEQNPNEIVTVFTDKQTGKVIVQFPSETLIALAKFFDKIDGTVVNQKV